MIRPIIKLKRRRIFLNVDTQNDFLLADGKACVRNHRRVLMNIRRMNAWARSRGIRVINTELSYSNQHCDKHDYCKTGSKGAKIVHYSLRNRYIHYDADGYLDLRRDIFNDFDQVILGKKSSNPFDEPRIDRLFSELAVDEVIVVGALVEQAVFETVLGLLQREKSVTVIGDAVGARNKEAADMAIKKMKAKGAKVIETREIAGSGNLNSVGACSCDRCKSQLSNIAV